jgi:hypothetical protein
VGLAGFFAGLSGFSSAVPGRSIRRAASPSMISLSPSRRQCLADRSDVRNASSAVITGLAHIFLVVAISVKSIWSSRRMTPAFQLLHPALPEPRIWPPAPRVTVSDRPLFCTSKPEIEMAL